MKTDLTFTNKAGISLQNIMDVLITGEAVGKKDIQDALDTSTNIDALLKKLEDASLIQKQKDGNKLLYTVSGIKKSSVELVNEPTPDKVKPVSVTAKKKTTTKKTEVKPEKVVDTPVVENVIVETPVVEVAVVETPVIEAVVVEPPVVTPPPQPRKSIKANPTRLKTPAEVKEINKQTESISKEHQIKSFVEVNEKKKHHKEDRGPKTIEVNESDLELLKKNLESKLGKEVTAVLHKRNDRALKERKKTAQEIYEAQQARVAEDAEEYGVDNPYRFVLNFFTTTINGENATPYFRRRDEYVVKSIYNKFKSLCEVADDYVIAPQNLPFYRVITISMKERMVKMYHIDMNRVVRGVYKLFKLNQFDDMFIKFKDKGK